MLTLLWSQVPSVAELTRLLNRKDLLWAKAVKVHQQALSEHFLSFPAEGFERVFEALVPKLKHRWHERTRPITPSIEHGLKHFKQILTADGAVLEASFRKLENLQDVPPGT